MNKAGEYKDTAAEKTRQTKASVADTTWETANTTMNKACKYTDSAAQKANETKYTAMEKTQEKPYSGNYIQNTKAKINGLWYQLLA